MLQRYFIPSIKDFERIKRSGVTAMYSFVMQPQMIRPSNHTNALNNVHLKNTFTPILLTHWMSEEFAEIVAIKAFVTIEEKYFVFKVRNEKLEVK